jgi:hypothetical protein
MPQAMRFAAQWSEYALHALTLTQPILGLLHTNAHGDRANLFFLGQLPALIGQDRPLAKQLLKVHETVGLFLLGLIALHASAALYHHFWRRDDTLEAMLPQGMRRRVARRSSTGISSRARPKFAADRMEKLFTVHHDRYRCLAVNRRTRCAGGLLGF